jgi:putative methionine-R-sulfoxide reductase with GAF domain
MPIDPALLAVSIATLTELDPDRDLAATLEQAVVAAKQLFAVDAAGIMLADADGKLRWASASDQTAQTLEDNQETFAAGPCLQAFTSGQPAVIGDAILEPHWGEITLAFVELQVRSGLSVPVELGGGPIGTLDVYAAAPGGWDQTEISALQTYAGLVATLLGAAAKAQAKGRLAEQLKVALDARILIEQAKGRWWSGNGWTTGRPSSTCSMRPGPPDASLSRGPARRSSACPRRSGGPSRPGRPWTVLFLWTWGPWTVMSLPSSSRSRAPMGSGTG